MSDTSDPTDDPSADPGDTDPVPVTIRPADLCVGGGGAGTDAAPVVGDPRAGTIGYRGPQ
jgi:hypothetical protein